MVAAMRELDRRERRYLASRRPAAAWLTIAALLALGLSQPLHASAPIDAGHFGAGSALVAAANPVASQHADHDADLCSLCRATAQARLGVRVCACAGDLTASAARLPLPLPAPELAACAPDLRDAPPRAPPSLLRLLA
jgi:hypothetical protein